MEEIKTIVSKDGVENEQDLEELVRKNFFKESKKLKEAVELNPDIRVYMNTWANYNEYGADPVLCHGLRP